ncbi:gluconokinase (plasmid) [Azospirillum oryzae]|uniref:Gluconokinase n=1 Tax=Azospirillum oryzae TaxID=286727 RepID=A0A6N1AEA7_9PROT|nr:gluconokinase [Azospirillum oryzae]KAA0588666.1 gluconokinase [Azospirillum oryzae]QKS50015.1 gluconokinase [Azospirillum oryzae]GLR82469.1 gluconokinase [Azospirillum oryzae]
MNGPSIAPSPGMTAIQPDQPAAPSAGAGPQIVVVMGVAGCGKSSVGQALALALGDEFIEGDAHHPPANIEKMSAGIPLTDADRDGWLGTLAGFIADADREGRGLVVACSALKRRYRDRLRGDCKRVVFLHLHGDKALIASRMGARTAHFMPMALVDSQFADLEMPAADEPVLSYEVTLPAEAIVADAHARLTGGAKVNNSGSAAGLENSGLAAGRNA